MFCEHCGAEGPTRRVKFQQNIGMVYARRSSSIEQQLCRPCIERYFRSYTLTTLFLGWWGLISLVLAPIFILGNMAEYWRARSLPAPGIAAMNRPIGSPSPPVASGSFTFKLIYGAIIWTGVIGAVAYYQVDFMQKHAPLLNAHLHGGEITDEADGEYAGSQIGTDIAALEADIKGKGWSAVRAELLARESYLTDLNSQNDRLQRRLVVERAAKLGANDPCEQWTLDGIGPSLNNYASAETALFASVTSMTELTSQNASELENLTKRQEDALQKLLQAFSNTTTHGCKN